MKNEVELKQQYDEHIRETELTADYIIDITRTNIRPPLWDNPERNLFKALFIYFSLSKDKKLSVLEQVKEYLRQTNKEKLTEWLCSLNVNHPSFKYISEVMEESQLLEELKLDLLARINAFSKTNAYQRFMAVNITSDIANLRSEDIPQIVLAQYFS